MWTRLRWFWRAVRAYGMEPTLYLAARRWLKGENS